MPLQTRSFGFDAAREILGLRLQEAEQREAARLALARREADRSRGVAWSGLGAGPPRPPRSRHELLREAEAADARARDFAQSPRGRFLASLHSLQELGYGAAADRARAAFTRGFADPQRPACPAEIGTALSALARLDRPEARRACLILLELLTAALGAAAE